MIQKIVMLIFLMLLVTLQASDMSISQSRTSDWNNGFCENVKVKNISTQTLQWEVSFVTQGVIYNMWNANYQQDANYNVKATGVSWNSTLSPNQEASFGYCANKVEENFLSLDSSNLIITKTENSSWADGFCETVKITNPDNFDIKWSISTPVNGKIYNLWNANYTQDENNTLTAQGVSWNEVVKANSSRQFGYCANRVEEPLENTDLEDLLKDKELLTFSSIAGANNDEANITTNLNLMSRGVNQTNIVWSSSDETLIANGGLVFRPAYDVGDKEVTLTATLSKGSESDTKAFSLTVAKLAQVINTDLEDLLKDKALLTFDSIAGNNSDSNTIQSDLTLPTSGVNGSTITWYSSDTAYVSNSGTVTLPTAQEGNQNITLTATLSKGNEIEVQTFLLVVIALSENSVCKAEYIVKNEWNTGAGIEVIITNYFGTLSSWEVTFAFPSGQTINGNLWRGVETQTGKYVSVLNESYNGNVANGGKFDFGFNLQHTGTNEIPTDIRLNGNLCEGQVGGIDAPTAAENFTATLVGNTHVDFTWSDMSDNEDNFVLYQRENQAEWQPQLTLDANTTSYTGLAIDTTKAYEFKVVAQNLGGSNSSGTVAITPLNNTVLEGVQNHVISMVVNCMACHTQTDSDSSIPIIHGLDKAYLVDTLKGYRESETDAEHYSFAMHRIIDGYTDEEIDLMANYFSKQAWIGNDVVSYDVETLSLGETLYENNCKVCHGSDGKQDGIILSKQSEQYLVDTMTNYAKGLHKDANDGMKNVFENTIGEDNASIEALAKYLAVGLEVPEGITDTVRGFEASYVSNTNTIAVSWEFVSEATTQIDILVNNKVVKSVMDFNILTHIVNDDGTNPFVLGDNYTLKLMAKTAQGDVPTEEIVVAIVTDEEYGELHYNANCKVCHGVNGTARTDITKWDPSQHSFTQFTQNSAMPSSYYSNCDEECLELIGTYVLNVLAPRNNDNNSTEVTDVYSDIPRGYRLLNSQEYTNTLYSLFEIQNDTNRLATLGFESTDLPQDNAVDGFTTDRDVNRITESRLKAFVSKAESLEAYVNTLKGQEGAACIINGFDFCTADKNTFLSTFGTKIFRRPLSSSEITQYEALESIGQIVGDMLVSPNFLYRSEMGTETNTTGIYQLTNYEIATAIAYTVAGTTPDDTLLALAENDQLYDANTRVVQAVRLSDLETGKEKLEDFVGRWLLQDDVFSLSDKNPETFPGYDSTIRLAQSQQIAEYFRMVMESNSKSAYKDLFINDYMMTNKTLSAYYGNSMSSSESFEQVSATSERYGVLTLGAVASKYANSEESHPFQRGAFVLERLMCHEIGSPENAGDVPAIQEHAGKNKRDRFSEHVSDPACAACHAFMDPIGYTWEYYDGTGRYRTSEYHSDEDGGPKPIDASVTLKGLLTLNESETAPAESIRDVSQLIADSDRGPECMALQYYRYVSGDTHAELENSSVVAKIVADFKEEQYDLQSLFTNIVKLNSFITRKGE